MRKYSSFLLFAFIILFLSACSYESLWGSNGGTARPTVDTLPSDFLYLLETDAAPEIKDATEKPTPTPTPEPTPSPKPTEVPSSLTPEAWLKDTQWVTDDADIMGLGIVNIVYALRFFNTYNAKEIKKIKPTSITLNKVERASWKYVGKLIKFTIKITDAYAYAPGSDTAEVLAGGKVCAELVGPDPKSYDGFSHVIVAGSDCEKISVGKTYTITGIMIGYMSGTNAYGGSVENLAIYTIPELIAKKK